MIESQNIKDKNHQVNSRRKNKKINVYGESFIFLKINDKSIDKALNKIKNPHKNKALFLSHNEISDTGFVSLCNSLKKDTIIEHLVLSNNKLKLSLLTEESLKSSFKANKTLKFIVLNHNSINNVGAIHFANSLEYNCSIKHVMLSHNIIEDLGFIYLLKKIRNNSHIESLIISHNKLTNRSLNDLIEFIKHAKTLKKIDVSGNNFNDSLKLNTLFNIAKKNKVHLKITTNAVQNYV